MNGREPLYSDYLTNRIERLQQDKDTQNRTKIPKHKENMSYYSYRRDEWIKRNEIDRYDLLTTEEALLVCQLIRIPREWIFLISGIPTFIAASNGDTILTTEGRVDIPIYGDIWRYRGV